MSVVSILLGRSTPGTTIARNTEGVESVIRLDATLKEELELPSIVTEHPIEGQKDVSDHIVLKPNRLEITGVITETPFALQAQVAGVATLVASKIGLGLGNAVAGVPGFGGPENAATRFSALATLGTAKTLSGILAPPSVTGQRLDPEAAGGTENIRLRDAVNEFARIRNERVPLTIITGLKRYENYVIENFIFTRATEFGKSLRVNLRLKELNFAVGARVVEFIPVRVLPAEKEALPKSQQGQKSAVETSPEKSERGSSVIRRLLDSASGLFGGGGD